jgi:aminoglycoside/choline kinase family phosphotransferase
LFELSEEGTVIPQVLAEDTEACFVIQDIIGEVFRLAESDDAVRELTSHITVLVTLVSIVKSNKTETDPTQAVLKMASLRDRGLQRTLAMCQSRDPTQKMPFKYESDWV